MRKFSFLCVVACFCAGAIFMNCNNANSGTGTENGGGGGSVSTIKAKVENGNNYNDEIDEVWLMVYDVDDEYFENGEQLTKCKYKNGSFEINLPSTVKSSLLWAADDVSETETSIPDFDITISDKSAKIVSPWIEAYSDGEYYGEFIYGKYKFNEETKASSTVIAMYYYADRDVTIKGSGSGGNNYYSMEVEFNLSFKKGWNEAFSIIETEYSGTGYLMTTKFISKGQSGLKWYFEKDWVELMQDDSKVTELKNICEYSKKLIIRK